MKNYLNYSTTEVAKKFGITPQAVRNLCRRGMLDYVDKASGDSSKPLYEFTDEHIDKFFDNYHIEPFTHRIVPLNKVPIAKPIMRTVNESTSAKCFIEVEKQLDNNAEAIKILRDKIEELTAENEKLRAKLKAERVKTREFINNVIKLLIPLEEE